MIKKHKKTIFMLVLFAVLFVGAIYLKDILMPDDESVYGTRLDELGEHPIDDEVYTKISQELASNSNVLETSHREQGRIINIFVTLDDKATYKDATKIGDTILTFFSDDTKNYYSIQFFMTKKDEKLNNFPIMGIKGHESKTISWTPERQITVEETEEGSSDE